MNKMLRNIIIMAIVVIVAVGAVLLVPALKPEEPQVIYSDDPRVADIKPTPEPDASGFTKFWYKVKMALSKEPEYIVVEPTPDPAMLKIGDYMAADVVNIVIENEFGEITLYINDGIWYVKGREDLAVDQTQSKNIAYTSAYISAEQIISENLDRKADFGLEEPVAKVTATYSDGNTATYYLGDKAPANNEYYMMAEGDERIFTVWTNYANNAKTKLDDLRKHGGIDIIAEDVSKITITNTLGETYSISLIPKEGSISIARWQFTQPSIHDADSTSLTGDGENVTGLINELVSNSLNDLLASEVSDAQIKEYGLDEPIATVSISNADGYTITYKIGKYDSDSYYSLMFEDGDNIYKEYKSYLKFIENPMFKYYDKFLALINISAVDKLEINLPGLKTTTVFEHIQKLDEDGKKKVDANGNPLMGIFAAVDGQEMPDEDIEGASEGIGTPLEQVKWFYQDIIGLQIQRIEYGEDFTRGVKRGSIKYTMNTGSLKVYTLNFYDFDSNFYAVQNNDTTVYNLVMKRDFDHIIDRYDKLMKKELDRGY